MADIRTHSHPGHANAQAEKDGGSHSDDSDSEVRLGSIGSGAPNIQMQGFASGGGTRTRTVSTRSELLDRNGSLRSDPDIDIIMPRPGARPSTRHSSQSRY